MICKYCGKKLKKPEVAFCPHCKKNLSSGYEGNGFYDILTADMINKAPVETPENTAEVTGKKNKAVGVLWGVICAILLVSIAVISFMGFKLYGCYNEIEDLKENLKAEETIGFDGEQINEQTETEEK
ncbi:MAG: hypothetical protein E7621_06070 [Ruminococcaceae bacterium]|nr:hypothetical protein [Oscillospiraceae bacterium]